MAARCCHSGSFGLPPGDAAHRGAYRPRAGSARLEFGYAHLVLNFRDPAPPSPRGELANATPRRLPFRLMSRYLSSGMWPSFFSSFSKLALNVASASTIASKDFLTAAGKSSASMFCHFNSSRAIVLLQFGRTKKAHLFGPNKEIAIADEETNIRDPKRIWGWLG